MEKDGILPVPIFINGVEAHTVVRDLLTTPHEQGRRAKGIVDTPTLSPDCAKVWSARLESTKSFRIFVGGSFLRLLE